MPHKAVIIPISDDHSCMFPPLFPSWLSGFPEVEFDGATKRWWIEDAANVDDLDGETAEEIRPGSRLATSDDWEDAIRSSEMMRS